MNYVLKLPDRFRSLIYIPSLFLVEFLPANGQVLDGYSSSSSGSTDKAPGNGGV